MFFSQGIAATLYGVVVIAVYRLLIIHFVYNGK